MKKTPLWGQVLVMYFSFITKLMMMIWWSLYSTHFITSFFTLSEWGWVRLRGALQPNSLWQRNWRQTGSVCPFCKWSLYKFFNLFGNRNQAILHVQYLWLFSSTSCPEWMERWFFISSESRSWPILHGWYDGSKITNCSWQTKYHTKNNIFIKT